MLSLNAMADDEFMVITLEDGTTAEYNVADVTKVNFETRKEVIPEFTVTPAEGSPRSLPSSEYLPLPTASLPYSVSVPLRLRLPPNSWPENTA